jgi:hypothetical protein
MSVIVPVLVNADTIYQREDHNKRLLMFGRPGVGQYYPLQFQSQPISVQLSGDPWLEQVHRPASPEAAIYPFRQINVQQPAGQSLFFLTPKRPPPEFFFDRFASVYSVTEIDSQTEATFVNPSQPYLAYAQTKRPGNAFFEDHSLETGQTNHPYPHVTKIAIGLFPYSFEVPDLNADPWLELVHRPPNPEAAIYPFRQIPQTLFGAPNNLMWWQSKNWALEAEPIWRTENNDWIHQFRWRQVAAPIIYIVPNLIGLTNSQANAVLLAAGFTNFSSSSVYDLITPPLIVFSQTPVGGTLWTQNGLITFLWSAGPYVPPAPPLPIMKVTTRNFSLEEMASREWGPSFRAPDHRVYQFSNGRGFDSTDMGNTGIYQKGTSTS